MKRIRIISPSGAIAPMLIDNAASRLRSWGYEVLIGTHAYGAYGGYGGTEEERLADLQEAFDDNGTDIVLCSRGGYGLCQIIDRLEIRKEHVPLLVGFSDITCLHNKLGAAGVPSLHAIMAKHISELPEDSDPIVNLRKAFANEKLAYDVAPHPFNRLGEAHGILRGGNMAVFHGLRNTPIDLVDDGNTILFIEDIGEPAHNLDRIMHNLRISGYLSRLKGLVVGQFADCREDPKIMMTIYESIRNAVSRYDYPVIFNFPAGHVDYNLPLLLNAEWKINITETNAKLIQI